MPRPDESDPLDGALALTLGGAARLALRIGALWDPAARLLTVADLHLGKAERLARRGGPLLPPYETAETLDRLAAAVAALDPTTVVCLGDSLDDLQAEAALSAEHRSTLARLATDRRWIWIAGNHDPAPTGLGGEARAEWRAHGLTFRHIAEPRFDPADGTAELSGHYHPKAVLTLRGRKLRRRCFLADDRRLILPAFGAYTGGLDTVDPVFDRLIGPEGRVLVCSGSGVRAMPR